MATIIVRKSPYAFHGRIKEVTKEFIYKGELPKLIGHLILSNPSQFESGLKLKWDESDPETKKYLDSRKKKF